jgi:ABC-2 type transport system permease protein
VFASIGLIFSGAVLIFKQTSSAVTYIATLMGLLGGIYFPVALLPGWAEWIANLQPLTPSVDLLRHLLIGLPLKESAWTELLKIVGFLIFLSPFTYALLLYAVRFSRRRATLLEY